MTLEEAIKLQRELLPMLREVGFDKYIASVRLGIEALKRVKGHRETTPSVSRCFLPGETEK